MRFYRQRLQMLSNQFLEAFRTSSVTRPGPEFPDPASRAKAPRSVRISEFLFYCMPRHLKPCISGAFPARQKYNLSAQRSGSQRKSSFRFVLCFYNTWWLDLMWRFFSVTRFTSRVLTLCLEAAVPGDSPGPQDRILRTLQLY